MSQLPILIRYKDLIKPILTTKKSLLEMKVTVSQEVVESILLEALIVFSISRFESMLSQIMIYIYKKVPAKLDIREVKLSKEDIIFENPIDSVIDRIVNNAMYGRIDEIISFFSSVLSISQITHEETIDRLIELKESRNLLIHNDSKVNKIYLEKCRSFRRATYPGTTIIFNKQYVTESLDLLLELLEYIENELQVKYSHYTNVRAFKELWNYTFDSSVLMFDYYWEVNEVEDKLQYKYPDLPGISSSEKMYLGIWLVHYNGDSELLNKFNMHTITDKNKMSLLLNALGDLHLGG